jgi:hypothetical protein
MKGVGGGAESDKLKFAIASLVTLNWLDTHGLPIKGNREQRLDHQQVVSVTGFCSQKKFFRGDDRM